MITMALQYGQDDSKIVRGGSSSHSEPPHTHMLWIVPSRRRRQRWEGGRNSDVRTTAEYGYIEIKQVWLAITSEALVT